MHVDDYKDFCTSSHFIHALAEWTKSSKNYNDNWHLLVTGFFLPIEYDEIKTT